MKTKLSLQTVSMSKAVFVGMTVAVSGMSASPESYDWPEQKHACVVENAQWMSAENGMSGPWKNAPNLIIMKFNTCSFHRVAAALGEEKSINQMTGSELIIFSECEQIESAEKHIVEYQVEDLTMLPESIYDANLPGRINSGAEAGLSSGFGRSALITSDGKYLENSFRTSQKGDRAWWMLQAECTPISD